jgi:hypothetical protein
VSGAHRQALVAAGDRAQRRLVRRAQHGAVPDRAGPGTTLPIEIFSYLQFQGSQLVIAAASAVRIALIVILVAFIERVVGIARITRARGSI